MESVVLRQGEKKTEDQAKQTLKLELKPTTANLADK